MALHCEGCDCRISPHDDVYCDDCAKARRLEGSERERLIDDLVTLRRTFAAGEVLAAKAELERILSALDSAWRTRG